MLEVFKGLVWGRVLNQYMGVRAVYFPTEYNDLLEVSGWFGMSSLPIYNRKDWYWWGGISSEEASKFEAETDHRLRSESFTAILASLIRGLRFHSNQRQKRSRSCPIQYDPLENHRILWGCMSFCHLFVLFEHNCWEYQPLRNLASHRNPVRHLTCRPPWPHIFFARHRNWRRERWGFGGFMGMFWNKSTNSIQKASFVDFEAHFEF